MTGEGCSILANDLCLLYHFTKSPFACGLTFIFFRSYYRKSTTLCQVLVPHIGNSRIYSPKGDILAASEELPVEYKLVEIDKSLTTNKNVTPRNNLFTDRRPELYNL